MKSLFYLGVISFILSIVGAGKAYSQAADDYRTVANGNWNANATWQRYDGANWINVNGTAPNTIPNSGDGIITIRNTHTVTVSANVTSDQTTVDAGGKIVINSGQTLTIANGTGTDLTVNGAIDNNGSITTTGTLSFGANSTYTHSRNGGTIPTATWNVTSSCIITGVTGSVPGGLSQTFGDFTWNCTGQSSDENLNGNLTTVNGKFTLASTGTGGDVLRLTNGTDLTLNIGGDFIVSGGDLVFTNNNANVTINVGGKFTQTGGSIDFSTDNQIGILVLNVTGDFSQSGGFFDFTSGDANTSRTPSLNLSGDFSHSGTAIMTTSTGDADIINGTITFNKNGAQKCSIATQANLDYVNFVIAANCTLALNSSVTLTSSSTNNWAGSFTVNSGGILDAVTYQVLSSTGSSAGTNNDFILNSGAGILTAEPDGIQSGNNGTVSTSIANRTFSSGANYTYDATVVQNSGTFTTTPAANQVNNLTIDNSAGNSTNGVSLQQTFSVAGTLTLTNGLLTTTTTNLLTLIAGSSASFTDGSTTSFVNGPMAKAGTTAFTFPVGKLNAGMRKIGISAPSATTTFRAEFLRTPPPDRTSLGTGISQVSPCEYWTLDRTAGSSSVSVTLSWNGNSPCNAAAFVTDLATLKVSRYNGSQWTDAGNASTTGNASSGTITSETVSSFSPFTLGNSSSGTSPLPVKFTGIKAWATPAGNKIEWANATEAEVRDYQVERSVDGIRFITATTIQPENNNGAFADYSVLDNFFFSGAVYYRVKATEFNGKEYYTTIVKVQSAAKAETLAAYPNPVTAKQFVVQLYAEIKTTYRLSVISSSGQLVMEKQWQHPGNGIFAGGVELPAATRPGIYFVTAVNTITGLQNNLKLIVQ